MGKPLVTVAIPAYNVERYIVQTIESVLAQTYTNFELLIRDDCSTDRTYELISAIKDPRIVVSRNDTNRGSGYTRNALLAQAKGDYYAIMDSDDICTPDRLQIQVDYMEQNPDVTVCGGVVNMIDEHGKSLVKSVVIEDWETIRMSMMFTCPFIHPTVMMRMSDIRRENISYGCHYYYCDDMELWDSIVDRVKCVNLPVLLLHYRVWSDQISTANISHQSHEAALIRNRRIKSCGVEMTDEEEQTFHIAMMSLRVPTDMDISIVKRVLIKIWKANKINKIYNPLLLKKELLRHYKHCYKKKKEGRIKRTLRKLSFTSRLR